MYQILTVDEWVETYKPIKNPNNDWGDECRYSAFETYGSDVEYVQSRANNYVWTEVDGDDGIYIVAGYAFVNRIQYYVCEVPFDSAHTPDVLVCLDQDCEACENPETESDCPDCGSMGYISHYPDTREELAELIGDTQANIKI